MTPLSLSSDGMVIVEADGFGGATISVVEGNYPIDYITKVEKFFPSQKDAEAAAEAISLAEVNAEKILGAAA